MNLKPIQKPIYSIALAIFFVIALSSISIIASIANKNSDELSMIVTDLSKNRFEMDKLDEAIQLLYDAENNSRIYVLTKDINIYTTYRDQLTKVLSLIVSIQKDDEDQIAGLVTDKKLKTELYINARLLADSLIQNKSIIEGSGGTINTIERTIRSVSVDTVPQNEIVEEYLVENKSDKRLFGRIRDAIVNKPTENKVKNVTIIKSAGTPEPEVENLTVFTQPLLKIEQQNSQSIFFKLSEKERALLTANEVLFQKLKDLLQSLKNENIESQKQYRLKLTGSATDLVNVLKSNSNYSLILSLVLTLIILSVLLLLYKNMQELQKAKLVAEDYAKYKSEFIATLSHEIRTPLHSIHAFTDELSKTNKGETDSEVIDAIKLSSNMLISVVNNILDFTKMENGKFKLNSAPFIPSIVIQEVLSGLAIQATRKNLLIVSNITNAAEIEVYGDAFQFRQLLINIISNAIKYTKEGSITVTYSFDMTDDKTALVVVNVKDTGIGIEKDKVLQIFDEYNSNSGNSEIKEGSTGLGLSLVKRIVDYHKGKIEVNSEVGIGTSFQIQLPYEVLTEGNKTSALRNTDKTPYKILIVENDQLNIKILNHLFVKEKYAISNSFNGLEALENYLNNDFDLIITDISMPGLDGFELARKIRELPDSKKSSIPILVVSGYDPPEDLQFNDKEYINAWIVKPFDLNILLSKVNELIKRNH